MGRLTSGRIMVKTFNDMLRRFNRFMRVNKRRPDKIFTVKGGDDYVVLDDFEDMIRRYNRFKVAYGREPGYVEINPDDDPVRPNLTGPLTVKLSGRIGVFVDATGLYKLVGDKCKYSYYYNDKFNVNETLLRITSGGVNCTDACQLFEKVFQEMGYDVRVEHCKVKCADGEWYGHYLLNVKGFEFSDWVVWDYVSATKTGRSLGSPCCVEGFKHLGYGIL